jgi:HK97 family phage prohead protease
MEEQICNEAEARPYPNEHSCRLMDPGKYKKFARKNCYQKHEGKCIDFVFGIISTDESELQAMRYPTKTWTEKSARAHCKEHEGTFEPAKEEEAFYPTEETRALKVSSKAASHAKSLIAAGKINADGAWSFTAKDSHALMDSVNGDWGDYGLWFLVQDDTADEDTYQRYKYPYGKQGKVWRRAVIAAKQRASQQKFSALVEAADSLLQAIDKKLGKDEEKSVNEPERRYLPFSQEMRAVEEDGKMIIEGYPIVYETYAPIWGFREIIRKGAAAKALKTADELVLWDHESSQPMARRSNGTLGVKEDDHGVFIRADVSKTVWGRNGYEAINNKVIDKMSFAFDVQDDKWHTDEVDGEQVMTREIFEFAQLYDYSPVSYPAYKQTIVNARSLELAFRHRPEPEASGDEAGAAAQEVRKEAKANIEQWKKSTEERNQYETD